ncbi:hypothetical protein GYA49_05570 [Candidatus Beckwithbacteria bacterium]|nr:hypothetical protein [Candidatus Beckwithbacteria bacterium]
MKKNKLIPETISFSLPKSWLKKAELIVNKYALVVIALALTITAIVTFWTYYYNGLGIAYNDARSHLDIGRRVVEGLKPGLAQLGSVWLPLPHLLMVPTVWSDFMWHSGLAGALQSMIAYVATGIIIYLFLQKIKVGLLGRLVAVFIWAANLNVLYLQSTAMTELLLLGTMTGGAYYLLRWFQTNRLLELIKASFWIMLSTLIRYDGWFLLFVSTILIAFQVYRKKGYKTTEGIVIMFCTLAAFGIFLWLLWNQLIFKDALYFAFGPFSARAQQKQLEAAGNLPTQHNLLLSVKVYLYALFYNSYTIPALLGFVGAIWFWFDKKLKSEVKIASIALLAPLFFNIIALFFGHSVLFIQGISGNTWFNVRYGVMLMPSIAIYLGYLVDRAKQLKWVYIGLLLMVSFFAIVNHDAVTIDDARVGSSQKNVSEVSGWLKSRTYDNPGLILISAASHDAIIFSSGLPMRRFIHEGTGDYWLDATAYPDRWVRWIILRTYDDNDLTYKLVSKTSGFKKYKLMAKYPFADIYELKPEYVPRLLGNPEANQL